MFLLYELFVGWRVSSKTCLVLCESERYLAKSSGLATALAA